MADETTTLDSPPPEAPPIDPVKAEMSQQETDIINANCQLRAEGGVFTLFYIARERGNQLEATDLQAALAEAHGILFPPPPPPAPDQTPPPAP